MSVIEIDSNVNLVLGVRCNYIFFDWHHFRRVSFSTIQSFVVVGVCYGLFFFPFTLVIWLLVCDLFWFCVFLLFVCNCHFGAFGSRWHLPRFTTCTSNNFWVQHAKIGNKPEHSHTTKQRCPATIWLGWYASYLYWVDKCISHRRNIKQYTADIHCIMQREKRS